MRYFPKSTPRMKKILDIEYQKGYINTSVLWFSAKMKDELLKHLDRPGWQGESLGYLRERLEEEFQELDDLMATIPERKDVISECADIANFAMMIADIYRKK